MALVVSYNPVAKCVAYIYYSIRKKILRFGKVIVIITTENKSNKLKSHIRTKKNLAFKDFREGGTFEIFNNGFVEFVRKYEDVLKHS